MQTNLRKLLLRVMLASLGAAAVIGALAMLVFDHAIVWRVVGTTIATAVAAGLMMSMSMLADRERCHTAGVVGMGAVVAEFLLCLVLVWATDYLPWRQEERFILTMVWIAGTALPGMFFLRLAASPTTSLAGHVGAGAFAATFLVGAGAGWLTSGWSEYEDFMATGMILSNFGTLAALALIGAGSGD